MSRIESKLLEPLSVNGKEGAPAANGHEGRSRRPGLGEGGGNRTRGYITYPKKNCLAGFATIERALRQCDYAPGGNLPVSPPELRLSSEIKPAGNFRFEADHFSMRSRPTCR